MIALWYPRLHLQDGYEVDVPTLQSFMYEAQVLSSAM
jgi:hypothetical protein